MGTEPIVLRQEQETMLMTLRLHAQDARTTRPILDDRFAADVLRRVEQTPGRVGTIDGNRAVVCARARLIDDAVRAFLDRRPDAVVLHLGCGLDSRVLRIDPGPGVAWFDVDQEPVIKLRRRLYPERSGVTTVGASVGAPGWSSGVPTGRPRLVVAEGLLMYLAPEGVQAAIDGAIDPTSTTTVVADTVAPSVARIAGWQPAMRTAGTGFASTTADLAAVMAAHPELPQRGEVSVAGAAGRWCGGALGAIVRLVARVPAVGRGMVLRTYG